MRTFALAIATLLLLGACTDDPEPIEPKPSDSTGSRASVPELPKEAREDTPSGAATFVNYWVKVSNFASQTGDTKELRRISDDGCDGCRTYIELYEETYAAGGYFQGSEWKLSRVKVQPGDSEHLVFAHVDARIGKFKRTSDSKVKRGNQEDSDLVFGVSFVKNEWTLTQLGLESEVVR
jgi:hypothetical protein